MGDDEQIIESTEFLEFIDREFRNTSKNATVEELAEFPFGSVEEAFRAFNNFADNPENDAV